MMPRLIAILLTISTVAVTVAADLPVLKAEAKVANRRCEVEVTRSEKFGERRDYWGTDGTIPSSVVSDVRISVDGTEWPCPREAFQDLAEVQYDSQVGFDQDGANGSVVIIIRGGDGAGAYAARLTLVDKRIATREITSGGGFVIEVSKWREGIVVSRVYTNSYGSEKSDP